MEIFASRLTPFRSGLILNTMSLLGLFETAPNRMQAAFLLDLFWDFTLKYILMNKNTLGGRIFLICIH